MNFNTANHESDLFVRLTVVDWAEFVSSSARHSAQSEFETKFFFSSVPQYFNTVVCTNTSLRLCSRYACVEQRGNTLLSLLMLRWRWRWFLSCWMVGIFFPQLLLPGSLSSILIEIHLVENLCNGRERSGQSLKLTAALLVLRWCDGANERWDICSWKKIIDFNVKSSKLFFASLSRRNFTGHKC